jgi:hypothetical protein
MFDYTPFEKLKTYDYNKAVPADVLQWLIDETEINEAENTVEVNDAVYHLADPQELNDLIEKLDEILWIEDSVTGNGSGTYQDAWKAKCNLWNNEDLIEEVTKEFEISPEKVKDPEHMDISIRCYLLSGSIYEVVDALAKTGLEAAKKRFF